MGAKDTVMNEAQIQAVGNENESACEYDLCMAIALAQDEISFRAGIKEVVDLIIQTWRLSEHFVGFDIRDPIWQAKLKEWNIKEEEIA